MRLEDSVQLIAGLDPEEPPQFRLSKTIVSIFLDRQGLERATRQILAGRRQPTSYLVRNLNRHVHYLQVNARHLLRAGLKHDSRSYFACATRLAIGALTSTGRGLITVFAIHGEKKCDS